ncbi:MAG: hypothetical protein KGJ06_02005 [Pseudomonadota bacterium]|nr:hypothetical protein [Pseudomonadota bacterium]
MKQLLQIFNKPLRHTLMTAAMLGITLMPIMANKAMAAGTVGNCGQWSGSGQTTCESNFDSNGAACVWDTVNNTGCLPEMSDYLAAAFVIVAGGLMFYIRRRNLAAA